MFCRVADEADGQKNIGWVGGLSEKMQSFATAGFCPNYDADAKPEQVVNALGPERYARLTHIKPSTIRRTSSR